ncbi:hypothetical protein AAFF_G00395100 [Aldrovandia affinis]|uniref:Uncharacterized protein n=1 Tax=Aldrovandia affinis TaxID=143900 RepID=A0AAD7SDS0_9TELE|nr:hypothetical protein AAFF_G00395100 [Aldrovandia affinis]
MEGLLGDLTRCAAVRCLSLGGCVVSVQLRGLSLSLSATSGTSGWDMDSNKVSLTPQPHTYVLQQAMGTLRSFLTLRYGHMPRRTGDTADRALRGKVDEIVFRTGTQ